MHAFLVQVQTRSYFDCFHPHVLPQFLSRCLFYSSNIIYHFGHHHKRYALAEMTHRASNFTEGVLEMERTVLGIIQVDARQILHDGLRKELVRQVSRAMHATLVFVNPKTNTASSTQVDVRTDLDRCLKKLGKVMDGFRRSVEYLQVYYISDFVACMQLVFVNSTEESVLFFLLFFSLSNFSP